MLDPLVCCPVGFKGDEVCSMRQREERTCSTHGRASNCTTLLVARPFIATAIYPETRSADAINAGSSLWMYFVVVLRPECPSIAPTVASLYPRSSATDAYECRKACAVNSGRAALRSGSGHSG